MTSVRTKYYLDSLIEQEDGYHMLFSQQATSAVFEYQEDWFHLLPKIFQPTLLVRAINSRELTKSDSERMQRMLLLSTVAEVSRPEHHVYLSDPEEFYSVFDEFLRGL